MGLEPADRVTADCHDDLATVLLPYPSVRHLEGGLLVIVVRGEISCLDKLPAGLLTLSHLIDSGGVSKGPVELVVVHSVYFLTCSHHKYIYRIEYYFRGESNERYEIDLTLPRTFCILSCCLASNTSQIRP